MSGLHALIDVMPRVVWRLYLYIRTEVIMIASAIVPHSGLCYLCIGAKHACVHLCEKYFSKIFVYICVFRIFFVPLQQILKR